MDSDFSPCWNSLVVRFGAADALVFIGALGWINWKKILLRSVIINAVDRIFPWIGDTLIGMGSSFL
jgi:hypothetical protein